jgi:hypothetical protein
LVVLAAAAFASPLFGTWKAELNGQPVTVVVSYVDRHVEGKMIVGTGSGARELPMVNPKMLDAPPMKMRFEVSNVGSGAKLVSTAGSNVTFELSTADGNEATLRVVGEDGASSTTVKAAKQK